MATWKKILHEDSTIPVTQIAGLDDIGDGQVIIGSGTGTADNHDLSHKKILVGDVDNNAKIANLVATAGDADGDIVVEEVLNVSGVSADVQFHIIDKVISTNKIVDDAVTLVKTAHQSNAGIVVYDDSVSNGDGVPTFLSVSQDGNGTDGEAGQVLKVKSDGTGFEFADAASASDVDISVHDDTRRPVIFGGEADDDSDTGQVLRKDNPSFNYLADQTFASSLYKNAFNSTITAATVTGETADLHVDHIKTNITGTAGAAARFYATNETAQDLPFPIIFSSNGDSGAFDGDNYASAMIDKAFLYNPGDQMLTVPNLKVTGTSTIVSTTNLHVEDKTIRVAGTTGTTTSADAVDSGLVVNIGTNSSAADQSVIEQNEDRFLPRILWANDSTTTKGWVVANKGTGTDSNLESSIAHGIAVLNHNTADITQNTLNTNPTYDHGIGAFFLVDTGDTPELYIQVE